MTGLGSDLAQPPPRTPDDGGPREPTASGPSIPSTSSGRFAAVERATEPPSWRQLWGAAWPGLALAAALRIALALQTLDEPLAMGADRVVYDEIAAALQRGALDERLLFVSPLYPHLLAALPGPGAVHAVQAAAGLATTLGVAALALVTGASRAAARAAALLFAAFASPLFFETQLYPTSLACLALVVGLALHRLGVSRGSLTLASGTALAVAVLLAQGLVLIPIALAIFTAFLTGGGGRGRAALLLLPLVIGFAGSALRNASIEPGFQPLGANGGVTLAHGNDLRSQGRYAPLPGSDASKRHQHLQARRVAELARGRPLEWSEVDAFWRTEVAARIRSDPAAALALLGAKAWRFATSDFLSLDSNLHYARGRASVLLAAPIGFRVLALLAIGALVLRTRWPAEITIVAATTALTCLLFYPDERYRLPAAMVLCVPAGSAVAAWRPATTSVRLAAALVVIALLAFELLRPPNAQEARVAATNHALNLEWSGRSEQALALYQEIYAAQPTAKVAGAIARIWIESGALEEALSHSGDAVRDFPEDSALHTARGEALRRSGDLEGARAAFELALAVDAPTPEAHFHLGRLVESGGAPAEAVDHYRAYVREQPGSAQGWLALARAQFRGGSGDEAIAAALERARALEGGNEILRARIRDLDGLLHERRGEGAEAERAFSDAVRLDPDYAAAARRLERRRARNRGAARPLAEGDAR